MGVNNPYAGTPAAHASSHQINGSDPLTLPQYDKDEGQPGLVVPTGNAWGITRASLVASKAYWIRFRTSRAMNIVNVKFSVTTAAASDDQCDIQIWDAACTTKLASTGLTSGKLNSTTGTKSIPLSISLTANTTYYAVFGTSTFGGSAANLALADWNLVSGFARIFGTAPPYQMAGDTSYPTTAGPYPVAAPTFGVSVNAHPLLVLSEV